MATAEPAGKGSENRDSFGGRPAEVSHRV